MLRHRVNRELSFSPSPWAPPDLAGKSSPCLYDESSVLEVSDSLDLCEQLALRRHSTNLYVAALQRLGRSGVIFLAESNHHSSKEEKAYLVPHHGTLRYSGTESKCKKGEHGSSACGNLNVTPLPSTATSCFPSNTSERPTSGRHVAFTFDHNIGPGHVAGPAMKASKDGIATVAM